MNERKQGEETYRGRIEQAGHSQNVLALKRISCETTPGAVTRVLIGLKTHNDSPSFRRDQ